MSKVLFRGRSARLEVVGTMKVLETADEEPRDVAPITPAVFDPPPEPKPEPEQPPPGEARPSPHDGINPPPAPAVEEASVAEPVFKPRRR